jgi:hypothetical protein
MWVSSSKNKDYFIEEKKVRLVFTFEFHAVVGARK